MMRSTNSVIEELITDPLLAKVLVGTLPLYAAERDKTPFATHAFVMDFFNQSAFRIVGGSDAIAHSLVRTIERYGGQVLTRQRAVRIVCDDTHAIGVETDKEQLFAADCIISDAHPMRTLELVDSKLIRPAFRSRIKAIPQTVGVFSVYLEFKENTVPYMNHNYYGYNTDTPWGCENYNDESWPKGFLYMHFCPATVPDASPSGTAPLERGHSLSSPQFATTGVILSYMRWSDVEQWADNTVGRRGDDYKDFKQRKAEKLIASLEKHIPGISQSIKCYYTSTPLTYRDYTGTERGGMYGCAKDIGMGAAGRVPHRTKIPNLLQTGQNINSHGMQGVIVGTIVTCSELLTAEKIYKQINNLK
jgi:all-trans-retinol 13,14-reductase